MTTKTSKASLSDQLAELEKLETFFQSPELDLDEALKKHTEALKVGQDILTHLDTVENTLNQVEVKSFMGKESDSEKED